ncbi:MAG TPA: 2-oxoacid:acceptor oxidoreductase family protein [Candidatus Syntrophosphaera sp.]|jgi:2-oxoglutarate ferredoxin oxidoreductase subunit gamma|nr:2-oxoacid:acceptor oxidoreductase family protein [Candidatus Syntrophosphaera thermopropionivorans]HRQ98493.1 2-oxoacid:acceptor oxidoreductase family protein [Candidatus Syntrophosphaera sp.]
MTTEMICAGFGGQGVLTIGRFLAQAGMKEGKNVSWLPSYGPEMRGGTANVSTVISDGPIASPIVSYPDVLVALNQPSLDKFGPMVRKGGVIIYNTNMCPRGCNRDDVQLLPVPMNDIANEIGSSIVLNMLAIGIIIGKTGLVKYETIEDELKSFLQEKNPDLLDKNLQAIKKGIEIGKQYT